MPAHVRCACAAVLAVMALFCACLPAAQASTSVSADGAASPWEQDSIRELLLNTTAVLSKLNADLGADIRATNLDNELLKLVVGGQQLTDPKTGKLYRTHKGNPLPFWVFEPEGCRTEEYHTVMFIGGMHADEQSPIYTSLRALTELAYNPARRPVNTRVVFVPLLNPDGFLRGAVKGESTTRRQSEDVDLNRNMMSPDNKTAVEDRFLKDLIKAYMPTHIISLHAPFGWLDYDGPADKKGASNQSKQDVALWLGNISRAGRIALPVNKTYAPIKGSLGDYGTNVIGTHVLTIEYPHAAAVDSANDWHNYGGAVMESFKTPGLAPAVTSAGASTLETPSGASQTMGSPLSVKGAAMPVRKK